MARFYEQYMFKPVLPQVVAYTGTAGTSAAVGTYTNAVRIVLTTAGYIAFNKTATTSDIYMPANVPEYFACNNGDTVSAIQAAAGGNLHVSELQQ